MKVVERPPHELGKGRELGQWLAGCAGAVLTTLPAFIILPVWFRFVSKYKLVDADGNEDDVACGMVCFAAGVALWVILPLVWTLTGMLLEKHP